MQNEKYKTEIFGTPVIMIADWSQSASPIWMRFGDVDSYCTGLQVADFKHQKYDAMRHFLEEYITDGGDNPDDFEAEIDAAIDAMKEVLSGNEIEVETEHT